MLAAAIIVLLVADTAATAYMIGRYRYLVRNLVDLAEELHNTMDYVYSEPDED